MNGLGCGRASHDGHSWRFRWKFGHITSFTLADALESPWAGLATPRSLLKPTNWPSSLSLLLVHSHSGRTQTKINRSFKGRNWCKCNIQHTNTLYHTHKPTHTQTHHSRSFAREFRNENICFNYKIAFTSHSSWPESIRLICFSHSLQIEKKNL